MYREAGVNGETVVREEKGPGTEEDRESPGDLSPGCTRCVQSRGVGLGKARVVSCRRLDLKVMKGIWMVFK